MDCALAMTSEAIEFLKTNERVARAENWCNLRLGDHRSNAWAPSGASTFMANETYDVFISYSRADARHAAEIDSTLRAHGLKSFFDRRNLAPGMPWIRALEEAMAAAKAAIVLIGPRGLGNTPAIRARARHCPAEPRSGFPCRAGDVARNDDRPAV
jgi:hypothetical protein